MGKKVVFLMLIMALLMTVVAAGSWQTMKNAAKGASGAVFKENKKENKRKAMEENEGDQAASDCDQGEVNNLYEAIGVTDTGLQPGKDRGNEFTDQQTPEENGEEQACDQDQGQNLAENFVDGARNIIKQPAN